VNLFRGEDARPVQPADFFTGATDAQEDEVDPKVMLHQVVLLNAMFKGEDLRPRG
jgi:hypothetical protein